MCLVACAASARRRSSPAPFAQSQATTGVIEGTVVDESGAPVPGAT